METQCQWISSTRAPWPTWWWATASITKTANRGPGMQTTDTHQTSARARMQCQRIELKLKKLLSIRILQPMRARFAVDPERLILQHMRWRHHTFHCQRAGDYCLNQRGQHAQRQPQTGEASLSTETKQKRTITSAFQSDCLFLYRLLVRRFTKSTISGRKGICADCGRRLVFASAKFAHFPAIFFFIWQSMRI